MTDQGPTVYSFSMDLAPEPDGDYDLGAVADNDNLYKTILWLGVRYKITDTTALKEIDIKIKSPTTGTVAIWSRSWKNAQTAVNQGDERYQDERYLATSQSIRAVDVPVSGKFLPPGSGWQIRKTGNFDSLWIEGLLVWSSDLDEISQFL
jgi:hypothetical protein